MNRREVWEGGKRGRREERNEYETEVKGGGQRGWKCLMRISFERRRKSVDRVVPAVQGSATMTYSCKIEGGLHGDFGEISYSFLPGVSCYIATLKPRKEKTKIAAVYSPRSARLALGPPKLRKIAKTNHHPKFAS